MNSQSKVKLQVWLMIALVFVLGGITGAGLDRVFYRQAGEANGPGRGRGPAHFVKSMTPELGLTPEQEKSIVDIFESNRKNFRSRMAECPGMKEMREQTNARIKEVLTPEQRVKFDDFNARHEAQKKREADDDKK
jgi:Spy/CpxP family protein refolding chaperone